MKINKKGVTLVELLASLALVSVVLVAIAFALASYGGQYTSMTQRLRAQQAASLIAERIELSVRYSQAAYISTTDDDYGCNMMISSDGRIFYKPLGASSLDPIIEEASYNGYNCNLIFTKASNNDVAAQIIIYKGDATVLGTDEVPENDYLYSTTRTIRLLNTSDAGRAFDTGVIADYDGMSHKFKYK